MILSLSLSLSPPPALSLKEQPQHFIAFRRENLLLTRYIGIQVAQLNNETFQTDLV